MPLPTRFKQKHLRLLKFWIYNSFIGRHNLFLQSQLWWKLPYRRPNDTTSWTHKAMQNYYLVHTQKRRSLKPSRMTDLEFSSFSSRIPENTTSVWCACPYILWPCLPATGPLRVSDPELRGYKDPGFSHHYHSTFRDGAQRDVILVCVDFRGPCWSLC